MKKKHRIILSVVGVVLSTSLLVASSILAEEELIKASTAVTLTVVSVILVIVAVIYACKVDYETGVYECRNCGHTFKPAFKAYVMGAHTLTTRHLKCPKCEGKSWCRRKTAQ